MNEKKGNLFNGCLFVYGSRGGTMILLIGLVIIGTIIVSSMYLNAHRNHLLEHHVYTERGIEESKQIFFISDTHNRNISKRLLQKLQAYPVDWIIIGGDFADKRTSVQKIEGNLKKLTAIAPTFFVWGNNDEEVGEETIRQLMKKYGVTIVENESVILTSDQNVFRLSAVDFHEKEGKVEQALSDCKTEEVLLFVAHNPQEFEYVQYISKPLIMMGGHYHGGQIRLGKYSVFPKGSFDEQNGVYTLISNGYGTTLLPLRLGAPVQTHILTIKVHKKTAS
jgi:uncharacterized protein